MACDTPGIVDNRRRDVDSIGLDNEARPLSELVSTLPRRVDNEEPAEDASEGCAGKLSDAPCGALIAFLKPATGRIGIKAHLSFDDDKARLRLMLNCVVETISHY